MVSKDATDEDGIPPKKRTTYYGGDEDKPKQYILWRCERKGKFRIRQSGKRKEREGCGELNICYTAKHWGWPSDTPEAKKNQAWQERCRNKNCQGEDTPKRTRLNRGKVFRIFDTLAEAKKEKRFHDIMRKKDELLSNFYNAETQMQKNVRKKMLTDFCKKHGLSFYGGDLL